MVRYRITTQAADGVEQTWVLLPDEPSAVMQAEELSRRQAETCVRVYREETGEEHSLILELQPHVKSSRGQVGRGPD